MLVDSFEEITIKKGSKSLRKDGNIHSSSQWVAYHVPCAEGLAILPVLQKYIGMQGETGLFPICIAKAEEKSSKARSVIPGWYWAYP